MHSTGWVVATLLALGVAVPAARPMRGGVDVSARQPAAPPPDPRVVSRATPHLSFTATISPAVVVPGAKMSIAFDVVPKKGMHVYAPGSKYRPVAIRLEAGSLLRVHGSTYPKPTLYLFKPLKEEVKVYDAPFKLVISVMADDAEALRAHLRGRNQMTIKGTFDYQACDDSVCYLPAAVPFQWTLRVAGR
jgi:cytochrome c biogenesis DsbD-like protein